MKIRTSFVLGAVGAALLVPASAEAAPANGLAEQTQLIISGDRLVPIFSYTNVKIEETNNNVTTRDSTSGSSTSLLWGSDLGVGSVHTVPRVAFDFALGSSHITVGGALAFGFSLGGSRERERNQGGTTVTTKVDAP